MLLALGTAMPAQAGAVQIAEIELARGWSAWHCQCSIFMPSGVARMRDWQ
jgi:hypothetical protein